MIKVAHLYYDLLNLYGEQGNILALKKAFYEQNIEIEINYLSVDDEKDFKKYDLIYMGTGSNDNLLIVLDDIKKYGKQFKAYIEKGKYLIATGNSYLLFGKYIQMNNNIYDCLNIFDYYAKSCERIRGEAFMDYQDLSPIIGFQNRSYLVQNNNNHLFSVISGGADNFKSSNEGYHYKNFIGTFLIGPILIRNPHFTDLVVSNIAKNHKYKYHISTDTYEYKAYFEYLKNFYEPKS
jgi:hypothetical protein